MAVEDIAAYTADLTRRATLNSLVNNAVAEAEEALQGKDPIEALRIIKAAGPKYDRLGGTPPEDPAVFIHRGIQEVARMVVTREHGV